MGSGESGRYYTSHGSNCVHHGALIHSFDGRFTRNPRTGKIQNIKSGGHGESALEVMGKNGIKYNIVKTYLNGVRVGNIPSIKDRAKKQGTGMAWFPKTWTTRNMVRAGEHVSGLKHNRGVKDGVIIWETYKGVRVGVIKTNGQVATVFPDARYQPVRKKWEEALIVTYEGIITNEIMYGAQAIVKLLGDGTAAADPTRVETPEPGAEFRVYLQRAGSYDNARDIERDYLVTDANGYAMTKALPYGVYVLEQVKGKEGYEIKGPITFEIDGSESIVNPPPLTLSDQPILYRLKFIKTDSVTGKIITLSNASFKLKDANGEYVKQTVYYPREQVIDTFITDDTGSVTLPETVTWGLYFVEEVKAPEGYLIRTESLSVFVGHEGDQPGQTYELEIEIPNDPVMGRILLDKKGLQLTDVKIITDAWGNEVHTPVYEEDYLAGAVFEIRAAADIIGKDGTVWYQADELVDTIITTANGGDASRELPLGKYNVIEVAAPEGYFFTDRAYVVDLKYKDDHTALVEVSLTVENDFLPAEISLFKEKETISIVTSGKDGVKAILTNEAGEGFVFGLFTAEDMPYAYGTLMADTLVATGATDKNGMLTLTGTFPHGDYYIRELAAPDGWKITADRFDLSITPDRKAADENVLRVLMVDAIHNELIHTKVTLTKTDITGEKTLPGAIIEVYNESGKIIYRDTTDEMGRIAKIPVTPGRYTFREVYAPDGYSLNDVTMSFTVSEDGIVTSDTTIRDDYTRFFIEKLDEADEPLAGVEFSLVSSNGVAIMSARTDRNGIATFEKVPFGTYRIVEAKPLAGYLPAEMEAEVTIDGTFINPEHPIATIINVPNEIVIRKVDQDGKPLGGASFGLFDAFGERFAVAASDENGMVHFTKVPYGSYTMWHKVRYRIGDEEWETVPAKDFVLYEGYYYTDIEVYYNAKMSVRLFGDDENYFDTNKEIRIFDHYAPEVTAGFRDLVLHVEAVDDLSEVAGIQVNSLLFTTLVDGVLDVRMEEPLLGYKQLAIRAYDYAGNFSDPVTLDNPYYVEPTPEPANTPKPTAKPTKKPSTTKKPTSGSSTAKPTATPVATATPVVTTAPQQQIVYVTPDPNMYSYYYQPQVTAEPETVYVPLGPGQPYKSEGNMQTLDMLYSASTNKQFITVQTRAGETYYMIIDYDKPIDAENDIYETYFLNLVDDRDLMSVVSEDEIQPTPTPQIVYVTPEPTQIPQQTVPIVVEDDGMEEMLPTILLIGGVAAIGGAIFWMMKKKKEDAARNVPDFDDEYEFEDEEESDE